MESSTYQKNISSNSESNQFDSSSVKKSRKSIDLMSANKIFTP